ncbi:hypothetical protein RHGRI_030500 [Rhododendron griersonianum]|uniref:Uncharacterized protein n=1 Tax=Rhododendron griersonianum TaxID=479676 RepID=A0AAV6ISD8_9ERIC|nr:hypothetical protein RHGRI_030500 [Rhododendron griersonianum]
METISQRRKRMEMICVFSVISSMDSSNFPKGILLSLHPHHSQMVITKSSRSRKVREPKEETITLGPGVRDRENVFGVAHIFASFNETFIEVDPNVEHEEAPGSDGKDGFLSDQAKAIPGIEEKELWGSWGFSLALSIRKLVKLLTDSIPLILDALRYSNIVEVKCLLCLDDSPLLGSG